jgi:hypothetical protein
MKLFISILLAGIFPFKLLSQDQDLFIIKNDSSGFELTQQGASYLARLPLKCITKEFPNKTSHTSNSDSDHVLLPGQLHPSFYGCFDWHSSVHGHWMLVRLLKLFPLLPGSDSIRKILHATINKENISGEIKYFDMPLTASWERTYGWAWILKLDEELIRWNDADAVSLHEALKPLSQKIVQLWKKYLPKQTYPNRTGVHPNTAFGLVFALDYARAAGDTVFEKAIINTAKKNYGADKNIPASWEPDGADFLSPSLEEADLMRRVLTKTEFLTWFNKYITLQNLEHLTILPLVSDRSDLQIVHLDGLCFSRSWCMNGLASVLTGKDKRKKLLQRSAINHLSAALPHIVSGEYGGEHWLASFAVYALSDNQSGGQ